MEFCCTSFSHPTAETCGPAPRRAISEVIANEHAVETWRHAIPSSETPMAKLREIARVIATSPISVLLLGATGVGKEVLAREIHDASPRCHKPMVKLNCAALPEHLVESELFGYERGAFTGASRTKPGLLETAARGTLFLDEVGELPLATQAKLLRAIDAREVMRVGGLTPRPLDLRFIAATNRDLGAAVADGRFREDLYYRLNGMTLALPPLRERADEILPLATSFAAEACAARGQPAKTFAPSAVALLYEHNWPGNIRELRNVIERACVFCVGSELLPEHVLVERAPSQVAHCGTDVVLPAPPPLPRELTPVTCSERGRILMALDRVAGNQTRAARLLGISRSTLIRRLRSARPPAAAQVFAGLRLTRGHGEHE